MPWRWNWAIPRFDPHGDPIPTASGNLILVEQYSLPNFPLNQLLAGLFTWKDEPETVYAQLLAEGLLCGYDLSSPRFSSTGAFLG
jgi:DtxR family Mn-dependent transcriptional regulator